MGTRHFMRNGAVLEADGELVLAGSFGRLFDGVGDFVGLAKPASHFALGIAGNDECAEAETTTTFDHLGASVDVNDFFDAVRLARGTIITTTETTVGGRWSRRWGLRRCGGWGIDNYCFFGHKSMREAGFRISDPFRGRHQQGP